MNAEQNQKKCHLKRCKVSGFLDNAFVNSLQSQYFSSEIDLLLLTSLWFGTRCNPHLTHTFSLTPRNAYKSEIVTYLEIGLRLHTRV